MRRPISLALVLVSLLLVAAGCGGSGSGAAPKTASTDAAAKTVSASPKRTPPTGKKVSLHTSDYGRILADGHGRALYLFTHDTGRSRCYGACASAWPPLLTKGEPRAVGKASQELLGTVKRRDGRTQVTYAGHPVYYYLGDRQPGQVLCQAVQEYGGYWYVVTRAGRAVH